MTTSAPGRAGPVPWRRIITGDDGVVVAGRAALGTTAVVAVWPPPDVAAVCAAVDDVLRTLDLQASRFRPDSELSWLHRAGGGLFAVSDGLAELLEVALAAAGWTGGRVDPTVGDALIALGYDRDFAAIDDRRGPCSPPAAPVPVPGWQQVRLDGCLLRLPRGVRLDLGATAKAAGSDRAARAAVSACRHGGGVLVSLGGDIAVGGTPPRDGWPVTVTEAPDPPPPLRAVPAGPGGTQLIRLAAGGVATSSITCRQWRRAGAVLHHIVDPATGRPASGPWRTVTVAAPTCADANAAATAAIVAGVRAEEWLAAAGLPARLVDRRGAVRYAGGWPAEPELPVPVPPGSHVYAGVRAAPRPPGQTPQPGRGLSALSSRPPRARTPGAPPERRTAGEAGP
ncbi:MAG TPA: FAD:protein FMN transferase [Streptosporangiaceae bacterium]|nr:FAD:protein FMN transferase [Streptosporangiaceae bacterium]